MKLRHDCHRCHGCGWEQAAPDDMHNATVKPCACQAGRKYDRAWRKAGDEKWEKEKGYR